MYFGPILLYSKKQGLPYVYCVYKSALLPSKNVNKCCYISLKFFIVKIFKNSKSSK